jgi:hypothetical protein
MRSVSTSLACLITALGLCVLLSTARPASAQEPASSPAASPTPPASAVPEPVPGESMGPAVVAPTTPSPAAPTAPAALPAEPIAPAVLVPPPVEVKVDDSKKWVPTFYGFAEFDAIADSTESFVDLAGNGAIARHPSYAADHARLTFGARNSRLGLKLAAPQIGEVKSSGVMEMDFLGNQAGTTESAIFTSPVFRIRHMYLKVETPYVDVMLGQTWQLFGWQSYFHPCTVELQGVPGQVYSRAPQARFSHRFKGDSVDFEMAIAASRPPQRDSAIPDGQAGMRLFFDKWKGVHTTGGTGTAADAAAIGVSGVLRRFSLTEFSAAPKNSTSTNGYGISVDAMLPIVPASMEDRSNGLTLTGSFVTGTGIADLFTGLTGGVTTYPTLPPNAMGMAQTYTPNVDPGDVMYDGFGKLHAIRWQAIMAGLQYYFPGSGKVWMAANYSNMFSHNADQLTNGKPGAVFNKSQWADVLLFWDAVANVRFGLEGAWFEQQYADNVKAHNLRAQFSSFYIF